MRGWWIGGERLGRGVGADRLPQLPDQARRHHDGVRRAAEVV